MSLTEEEVVFSGTDSIKKEERFWEKEKGII
jgi:hypothetical protein